MKHTPRFPTPLHVGQPLPPNQERLLARWRGMLERRWLSNDGPLVRELEQQLAGRLGVHYVVAVSSGTAALELMLASTGLTEGEVIVPAWTFIGTVHALTHQGLRPRFVDVDPATHNLDPQQVKRAITHHTVGILGVHLWGRPCAVDEMTAIAERHNLHLLFDAAHALGCTHNGLPIGGFGQAEAFSLHATKFLFAGEGGFVSTNSSRIAHYCQQRRNFGFAGEDRMESPGGNAKLSEVHAAIALGCLEEMDERTTMNRRVYDTYLLGLRGIPGLTLLSYDLAEEHNHQYVVVEVGPEASRTRDELYHALRTENVLVRRYFYPGCHRSAPYYHYWPQPDLPVTEMLAERTLVLPAGPGMKLEDVRGVCELIREVMGVAV